MIVLNFPAFYEYKIPAKNVKVSNFFNLVKEVKWKFIGTISEDSCWLKIFQFDPSKILKWKFTF